MLVLQLLRWYHNENNGIKSMASQLFAQPFLFRCWSNKTSKLCITSLCEGNPPVTNGFPSQRACYMENICISWHHHGIGGRHHIWHSFLIIPHIDDICMWGTCLSPVVVITHSGRVMHICRQPKPSLVQIMACYLASTKPLPEPVLEYCKLDPWE